MLPIVIAVVGIGFLMSFAQSMRLGVASRFAAMCSLIQIPAFVALVWRLAIEIGWLSGPLVLGAGVMVGAGNALFIRANGRAALFHMQPMLGAVFAICTAACWFT